MNRFRQQVESAVRAVTLHSRGVYAWFGARSPGIPTRLRGTLSPEDVRAVLLYRLGSRLYSDFYCPGVALPSELRAAALSVGGKAPFVSGLSDANWGSGPWQPGWRVVSVEGDRVIVRRAGLTLHVRRADCASDGGALGAEVPVKLRLPKELPGASPGFHMILGDRDLEAGADAAQVRLYWNLTPAGALAFVRLATEQLNGAGLPFRLKVLNDPGRYDRCDAVVLYLHPRDFAAASPLLGGIHPRVEEHLHAAIPAFTRPLAAGLGLAEDPGGGESFGQHRCRLLAEGLLRAHEGHARTLPARMAAVAERFAEQGLSLDAPYLSPGSRDEYDFRPEIPREPRRVPGLRNAPALEPVAAARAIAERLMREAVRDGPRCNWIGADTSGNAGAATGLRYRALGPELYGGTAGIGLFLAELWALEGGDALLRETALGALRHALSRLDAVPDAERGGLYTGWTGIALAALRAGERTGDSGIQSAAQRLLARASVQQRPSGEFDVLSGRSGELLALLALRSFCVERALARAVELGEELLASELDEAGCWRLPGVAGRPLPGLAHGSAGAGLALVELYGATGDARFRRAAERAFSFERRQRQPGRRGARGMHGLQGASSWCNGSAGAALARLRAWQLLGTEEHRAEAVRALGATRSAMQAMLRSEENDASLCHGLAGHAEALLLGRRILGDALPDALEVVDEGARALASAVAAGRWPGGGSPGLMRGLAGVGHFLLRLGASDVAPILLVESSRAEESAGPPRAWSVPCAEEYR